MPSGLKRFQKAEALHFITFSCFHRSPLLDSPGSKDTVEAVLELTRARHQARVYAYVLMPEHVHFAHQRAAIHPHSRHFSQPAKNRIAGLHRLPKNSHSARLSTAL